MKPALLQNVLSARRMHRMVRGKKKPMRRVVAAQKPPKSIELAYAAFIMKLMTPLQARVREQLYPRLRAEVERITRERRSDALGDIDDQVAVIRLQFNAPQVSFQQKGWLYQFAQRTAEKQKTELDKQTKKALGVELPSNDAKLTEKLRDFAAENASLITSVPTRYLEQIQQTVMSGATAGLRWEDIAKKLARIDKSVKERAGLIARDQVGKLYGNIQQARQQAMGIETYIWETAGDERVRDEHQERDGKVFRWDDPPEDGHPGQPINCRCTATPNFEEAIDEVEEEETPTEEPADAEVDKTDE